MENRSHALIAGLFTLLLALAALAVVFWLQRDDTAYVPYDLVTYESVQGLSPQATVRYRGLPVGKVNSIGFEPNHDGAILIRIGVRPDTPMTDTLTATVEMQGITGIAYIDLDDSGKPGKPLVSSAARPARIQMRPGLTERLISNATQLMNKLQTVGGDLQELLGQDNRAAISSILQNTAAATERLEASLAAVEPMLRSAEPLMRDLSAGAAQAGKAAQEIGSLAAETRQALQRILEPQGLFTQLNRSLADIQRAVAGVASATPQLGEVVSEAGATLESARRTLDTVERAPQSLLFGAPRARPGPGEPGFSGFRVRGE